MGGAGLYTGCGNMLFMGMSVGVCDLGSMVKVIEDKGLTVADGVRHLERVLLQDSALTRQCPHWISRDAIKVAAAL